MISFGPQIEAPHSPDERVNIATVGGSGGCSSRSSTSSRRRGAQELVCPRSRPSRRRAHGSVRFDRPRRRLPRHRGDGRRRHLRTARPGGGWRARPCGSRSCSPGSSPALLGYTVVKLGVRYPSSGGLFAYLIAGLRQRPPGRHRGLARLLRGDRDRLRDGGGVLRQLRDLAVRRRRRGAAGTTSSPRSWCSAMPGDQHRRARARRPRAVGDRRSSLLAVFAVFIAVTLADVDLDLLAFSGYPPLSDIVASVALTFFAYLGLQRDHLRRRRPARPRRASCRWRCTRALGVTARALRPDLARRVRHAHRRRGRSATARPRSPRRRAPRSATPASR